MDIQKKIRAWNKKYKEPPWPIGVDLTKASDDAKFAATLLSPKELIIVSRFNVFKGYRNKTMRKIKWRYGIPQNIMAELTGLSLQAIKGITPKKKATKSER